MDCRNKKVIITGGSSGYGYGMAKVLKQRGAEVLITGRRLQVLRKAAKQLGVAYVRRMSAKRMTGIGFRSEH